MLYQLFLNHSPNRASFTFGLFYFSGDCCSPALRINIIDVDGFISQCELSFSNGESVQSVEVVSVSTNKSVSFCQMLEIFKVIKS